mmetsp:Transcript_14658/g.23881  ORF Transcript_14658/g.23881 Transcript_14658/m.23881 type:complete len:88 (+) Transcript_14658:810-1073(+)
MGNHGEVIIGDPQQPLCQRRCPCDLCPWLCQCRRLECIKYGDHALRETPDENVTLWSFVNMHGMDSRSCLLPITLLLHFESVFYAVI